MHHLRAELTPEQLQMLVSVALRYMHNPFLSNQTSILAAKITFQILDAIIAKFSQADAGRMIRSIMDSFIDKLESMVIVLTEVMAKYGRVQATEKDKGFTEFALIEKARPSSGATYAVERPEELVLGMSLTEFLYTSTKSSPQSTVTSSEPFCTPSARCLSR